AVLIALPLFAHAQTPRVPKPQEPAAAKVEATSPQHHLDEARRVLDSISVPSLTGDPVKKFSDLKRGFGELELAYLASMGRLVSPIPAGSSTTGSTTGTSTGSTPAV